MHTQPMADSDGDFSPAEKCDGECHKCKAQQVTYESWESSCGGYTDYKYTCGACGHSWWVDGPDS